MKSLWIFPFGSSEFLENALCLDTSFCPIKTDDANLITITDYISKTVWVMRISVNMWALMTKPYGTVKQKLHTVDIDSHLYFSPLYYIILYSMEVPGLDMFIDYQCILTIPSFIKK